MFHHGTGLADSGGQVGQGFLQQCLAADLAERAALPLNTRVFEQVADQRLHPLGTLHDVTDQGLGAVVQPLAVTLVEDLDAAGDCP